MTLNSVREDVQLLRENENGVRRIVHLNLLDASITQSPYFYLQQNDVIYVSPNKVRAISSQNIGLWLSMVSTVASAATVIVTVVNATNNSKTSTTNSGH